MKLELKHIVGYFPYGLKGNYNVSDVVPEYKCELRGKELRANNIDFFLQYAKPILRPLSDLTKEIEVNGERFVPILELYKMRTQHLTDKIDKYYIKNDTAILKLEESTYPDGKISFIHYFEIDIEPEAIHFSICTETVDNIKDEVIEERFGFIGNEFNMLQKLYEWHFDIHNLIENNLAINKKTIL